MNRPTCGTCPHRVNGACFLQPAEWQDKDTGPPVSERRHGCQHHPDMPDWVAQKRQPVPQQSRADWRSNSRPEYPSQVEAVRAFIGAPTWQQAREKLERQAQSGQQQAAAPEQLAELEQWRKALVWCKSSVCGSWSSLIIVRTGTTLAYVMLADGHWWVGIGGQPYPSRDAAMRAAEQALGLPKCRVEWEP